MSQVLQQLRASGAIDAKALESALRRQQIYGGSLDTVLLELDLIDAVELDKQLAAANNCGSVPVAVLEPGPERPWTALPPALLDLGWAMPLRRHMGHVQVAIHPEIPAEVRSQIEREVEHVQVLVTCEACLAKLSAERRSSVMPQRYAVLALKWTQALKRVQAPEPPPEILAEPEPAAPAAPWLTASPHTAPYTVAPPEVPPKPGAPIFKPPPASAPHPTATKTTSAPVKAEPAKQRSPTFLYGLPVDDDDDDDDVVEATPEPEPKSEPEPEPKSAPEPEAEPGFDPSKFVDDDDETDLEDVPAPRPTHNRGAELRPSASLSERLAGPRSALEDATGRDQATEALVRAAMVISPRVALFGVKREGLRGLESPGQIPEAIDQLVEIGPSLEAVVEDQETMTRVSDLDLRIAVGREMAAPCIFIPVKVHDRPVLMLYIDRDQEPFSPDEVAAARDLCQLAGTTLEGVLRRLRGEPEPAPAAVAPPAPTPPAPTPPAPTPVPAPPLPSVSVPKPSVPERPSLFSPPGSLLPPNMAKPPVAAPPPSSAPDVMSARMTPPPSVAAEPIAKPPVRTQPPASADKPPVRVPRAESTPAEVAQPSPEPKRPGVTPLTPPLTHRESNRESGRVRIQLDDEDRPRKLDPKLQELDQAIITAQQGDSAAVAGLREIGEPALRRIAKQFPGELDVHRRDLDTLPPLPAHGPLIRLALDIGPELGPYLVEIIDHPNPTVRFYIAFVFMELRHELAIPALGDLAFDPDADVRAIAMRVLETYSGEPGFGDTVAIIRRELDSPNRTRALHSTRAVGTLRDIESVPRLIELLASKERYIQEAALESLCSITGQQLGLKPHRWTSWYADNAHHHRVEWIISSLAHKDLSVRRWAADELRRITGQRINFLAAGNKQEREIGIRKWIEWWNERGRAEFLGPP